MKKVIQFLFLIVFFFSCSTKESGPDAGAIAAQSAKVYYEYLLKGEYGAFVDGRYQPHAMPESYRQQLITNAKMFVGQEEKEHRGLKAVRVSDARADTAKHVANAFLTFTYGDGTKEEVVVPMVESGGTWFLR